MKQVKKSKTKEKKEAGIRDEIRGLGVIIEHVDDKISLVAEQYGDIKKTLDSHTKTLDSHTEMIGNLAVDMTIVKSDVAVLKTDVSVLKTDVTIVKRDVEIMKTDIEFIKGGLKRKVDVEEFSVLERRVALLEKHR